MQFSTCSHHGLLQPTFRVQVMKGNLHVVALFQSLKKHFAKIDV